MECRFHDGIALIADPIHKYIVFTVPKKGGPDEVTEKDIIDTPWVQRLRSIYQLQSARWVYPSAEHSRFQHSIGAMDIAGKFAIHLYPSLKESLKSQNKPFPSPYFFEEILRITALLHDIGHGPFGHFFDDNFLSSYSLDHEILGELIIKKEFPGVLEGIRRSPNGYFDEGEIIRPEYIGYLMRKGGQISDYENIPYWLSLVQPLFSGVYTVDNLDYVLRDSYMCGVAVGPIDLERLMYYTFMTEKGIALHRAGSGALTMFLNSRLYLYQNVYYHRTTRAIDLHLKEIFHDTISNLFPGDPSKKLDEYLHLTDWFVLEEVKKWVRSRRRDLKKLGEEWLKILSRQVKWKMAYESILPVNEPLRGFTFIKEEDLEKEIRRFLPPSLRNKEIRVDMAIQDPRPVNPLSMGDKQIYIYNPSTGDVSKEPLREFFQYIPARVAQLRIYALDHDHDREISDAAEKAINQSGYNSSAFRTNI